MIDGDTFMTLLYVMSDEFCQSYQGTTSVQSGLEVSLSASEVLTLTLFSQWSTFAL